MVPLITLSALPFIQILHQQVGNYLLNQQKTNAVKTAELPQITLAGTLVASWATHLKRPTNVFIDEWTCITLLEKGANWRSFSPRDPRPLSSLDNVLIDCVTPPRVMIQGPEPFAAACIRNFYRLVELKVNFGRGGGYNNSRPHALSSVSNSTSSGFTFTLLLLRLVF